MTITECIIKLMDNTAVYNTITVQPFYTDNIIIVYGDNIELYIPIEHIYINRWYKPHKDTTNIIVDHIINKTIMDVLLTIRHNNSNVVVDYNKDEKGVVQITFD